MLFWLLPVVYLLLEDVAAYPPKEVVVNVITRKWTHLLNDKFLSFTLEPHLALEFEDYRPSTVNMFKSLSPAMLRVGGPEIDYISYLKPRSDSRYTVSDAQWKKLNVFREKTTLDLVVCLNPLERIHGVWQSKDALEFIDASDKLGYDLHWELGYELQRLQNTSDPISGSELGRDVVRLRKILDSFPRYSKSVIVGPDVIDTSVPENTRFLKEFFNESGDALSVLTWHPKFSRNEKENEINNILFEVQRNAENLFPSKEPLKPFGKPVPRKEIWIGESDPYEYTGSFKDAFATMKRLGTVAMLGFPVYLKHLTKYSLTQPTPDFWVSVLYKSLVGRAVLETKLSTGDKNANTFAHCTEMSHNNIIDGDFEYERGAVTLFGLNVDSEEVKLNIKASLKEEVVHMFILTGGNHSLIEETYLNGQRLQLSPSGQLPVISPMIKNATNSVIVDIPPKSVYFIVLPEIKVKQCTAYPVSQINEVKEISDQHSNVVSSMNLDKTDSETEIYVRFGPKKKKKTIPEDIVGESNGASPDKILKVRFPVPEYEKDEDKELDRSPKSVQDKSESNWKNKNSNDKMKTGKNDFTFRNPKNSKYDDDDDDENLNTEKISDNRNNEKSETKLNTKFIMFSDDDWLSNFSHAKKAVEAAKKIIAAFDEAERMKKKECAQEQSSVLKVENDRYHVQSGKDTLRKKKFAVPTTNQISDKDSISDEQLESGKLTTENSSTEKMRTENVSESSTTPTSIDVKVSTDNANDSHLLLSQKRTRRHVGDTKNFFKNKRLRIHSSIQEKPADKGHGKYTDSLRQNDLIIDTKSSKHKVQEKLQKRNIRSALNSRIPTNKGTIRKPDDVVAFKEPFPTGDVFLKEPIDTVKEDQEPKFAITDKVNKDNVKTPKEEVNEGKVTDCNEDKGDSDVYHPGEFYEHRNLKVIKVADNSHDIQDIAEMNLPGHNNESDEIDSKKELQNTGNFVIIKSKCADAETDKNVKEKLEKDLEKYYKEFGSIANAREEFVDYLNKSWNEDEDEDEDEDINNKESPEFISKINQQRPTRNSSDDTKSMVNINQTKVTLEKPKGNPIEKSTNKPTIELDEYNDNQSNKLKKDEEKRILTTNNERNEDSHKKEIHSNLYRAESAIKTIHNSELSANTHQGQNYSKVLEDKTDTAELQKTPDPQNEKISFLDVPSSRFNLEKEFISIDKNRTARENAEKFMQSFASNRKLQEEKDTAFYPRRNKIKNEKITNPLASVKGKQGKMLENERTFEIGQFANLNKYSYNETSNKTDEEKDKQAISSHLVIHPATLNLNLDNERVDSNKDTKKSNVDIICGRTKHFGTFCIGSERKMMDIIGELDSNGVEILDGKGNTIIDKTVGLKRRDISNSVKQNKNEWHEYIEEGSPTCKASRSAPYVEDFEELLSQMDEFKNKPDQARQRRLVHFTVEGVSLGEKDDDKDLPINMQLKKHNYDKDEEEITDINKDEGNIKSATKFYPRVEELSDVVNNKRTNNFDHGTAEFINLDNYKDENNKDQSKQTKRTIVDIPQVYEVDMIHDKQKDELKKKEEYDISEYMEAPGKTIQYINKQRDYSDINHESHIHLYPQKIYPETELGVQEMDKGSNYNLQNRKTQPNAKVEQGFVQLPGDVFSEIEGSQESTVSDKSHFIKGVPIQMMPVIITSPDMFRPKPPKTGTRKVKRSLVPQFRDVQNDINIMKNKLIQQKTPEFINQYPLSSHSNSLNKNNGIRTMEGNIIKRSVENKSYEVLKKEKKVDDKSDETYTPNEIMTKSSNDKAWNFEQNQDDDFDIALINGKSKQMQSLIKKSDATKSQLKEKLMEDGLVITVDNNNNKIEIMKNNKKKTSPNGLNNKELSGEEQNEVTDKNDKKSITDLREENTSAKLKSKDSNSKISVNRPDNTIDYLLDQMKYLVRYVMRNFIQF